MDHARYFVCEIIAALFNPLALLVTDEAEDHDAAAELFRSFFRIPLNGEFAVLRYDVLPGGR